MAVPKRRIHYPTLGKYFEGLREQRHWKQSQAADIARRRKLPLSYQALRGLEDGQTKHPTPAALKAAAALYEVPYAEIIAEVVRHAYDVDFAVSDGALRLDHADEAASGDFVPVRVLEDKIAAGPPLTINEADFSGHQVFSKRWLDRHGITKPLCVTVGRRERSMLGTINPGEIVLLDCSDDRRGDPKTDRIYAVNVDGGSTLKRIIKIDHGLLLVADNTDKEEYPTRALELQEDQSLLDVIVGEVMWKGQPL